jgi:hypothetical protein
MSVAELKPAFDVSAVAEFQTMIRTKAWDELDGWIYRAKTSLLASFANGVMKDRATQRLPSQISNGAGGPRARSPRSQNCERTLADAAGAERRTSEPSTEAALCLARARIPLFLFTEVDPNANVCVRINHNQGNQGR